MPSGPGKSRSEAAKAAAKAKAQAKARGLEEGTTRYCPLLGRAVTFRQCILWNAAAGRPVGDQHWATLQDEADFQDEADCPCPEGGAEDNAIRLPAAKRPRLEASAEAPAPKRSVAAQDESGDELNEEELLQIFGPGFDEEAGSVGKVRKHTSSKGPPKYDKYIYKILKNVHPKMRISKQAMAIMNSQVNDTFERISSEALKLSRLSKGQTLSVRDITSACRLVLPGELSKHAVAEGSRYVLKYKKLNADRSGRPMSDAKGRETSDKTEKTGVDSPMEKDTSGD